MCIRDRYKSKSSGRTLRPGIVLDEENRRVLVNGQPLELTETEFSILHCLAENRGRVVPVRTIYETVWHETYMPASNNTVMVHIVNPVSYTHLLHEDQTYSEAAGFLRPR